MLRGIQNFAGPEARRIAETLRRPMVYAEDPDFSPDVYQARVVGSDARLLRVLAPAGSGKTATLVRRAVRMVRESQRKRVLMLTFTNAGVAAFKKQLQKDGPDVGSRVTCSTLNAHGLRLLGSRARQIWEPHIGAIAKRLLPTVQDHTGVRFPEKSFREARVLWNCVGLTKQMGFCPTSDRYDEMAFNLLRATGSLRALYADLGRCIGRFDEERLAEQWLPAWRKVLSDTEKWFTFDDQKFRPFWHLVDGTTEVVGKVQADDYTDIFVDEFQDTNLLELLLVCKLAEITDARLCIAGDDDQCIYEFKGCTPSFILEPDHYIGGLLGAAARFETVTLGVNYRCPPNVTRLSIRLIEHNISREHKEIEPWENQKNPDAEVRIVQVSASTVAMQIAVELAKRLVEPGKKAENEQPAFGLLARKNSQLVPLQILFTTARIPYYIPRGKNLFLGEAYKAVEAVFHLRAHHHDSLRGAIQPALHLPIEECIVRLATKVGHHDLFGESLESLKRSVSRERDVRTALARIEYASGIKSTKFRKRIRAALEKVTFEDSGVDALRVMFGDFAGVKKDYEMEKDDPFTKEPPFGLFLDLASAYDSELVFVQDLLRARLEAESMSSEDARAHQVHLLTAHGSKGLQFSTVVVLDAVAGFWPVPQAEADGRLEEERRLFYVAMTRARSNLLFLAPEYVQGQTYSSSPFVNELQLGSEQVISSRLPDEVLRELLALYPARARRR